MNKIEEQLLEAYATMVMGGAMREDEVPETLILIEGDEPTTMRELVKVEVARRVIEILNSPEPEPSVMQFILQRVEAVEVALLGLMEMLLMPPMPDIPSEGGED